MPPRLDVYLPGARVGRGHCSPEEWPKRTQGVQSHSTPRGQGSPHSWGSSSHLGGARCLTYQLLSQC